MYYQTTIRTRHLNSWREDTIDLSFFVWLIQTGWDIYILSGWHIGISPPTLWAKTSAEKVTQPVISFSLNWIIAHGPFDMLFRRCHTAYDVPGGWRPGPWLLVQRGALPNTLVTHGFLKVLQIEPTATMLTPSESDASICNHTNYKVQGCQEKKKQSKFPKPQGR